MKVTRDRRPFFIVWAFPAHYRTSCISEVLQKVLVTFPISEISPHSSKKKITLEDNAHPIENYHVRVFKGLCILLLYSILGITCSLALVLWQIEGSTSPGMVGLIYHCIPHVWGNGKHAKDFQKLFIECTKEP